MSLLWPTRLKAETTVLVRLGRVVHWLSIALAAVIGLLGIIARGQRAPCNGEPWCPPPPTWFEEWGAPILFAFAAGLAVALIGRALRYVLSGE
jgi:hypothetical protein